MSRISVYMPQIAVPDLSGPRLQQIDVSSGAASLLESVEKGLDAREKARRAAALQANAAPPPPVDAVEEKEKRDANIYVPNALAKLTAAGIDIAVSNPGPQPGHTLDVHDAFDQSASEAFANAPNELAKQMLTRELPRAQFLVHKVAVSAEVEANLNKRYADAMETLDIFAKLIKADPSQLPERMAESLALGEHLFVSSYERAEYNARRRELPLIALTTAIERDPKSALLDMKEGRWSSYIDKETLSEMRAAADGKGCVRSGAAVVGPRPSRQNDRRRHQCEHRRLALPSWPTESGAWSQSGKTSVKHYRCAKRHSLVLRHGIDAR